MTNEKKAFENFESNVRRVTLAGTENYLAVPRKEWVQQWPGMVVISGSQVYWTESIEQDIKEGRSLGMFTGLLIGWPISGPIRRLDGALIGRKEG